MNTLSVKVEGYKHAIMLSEWLNSITFVKNVSILEKEPIIGNVENISKLLSQVNTNQLFSNISNPVEFQNQLRDEWK